MDKSHSVETVCGQLGHMECDKGCHFENYQDKKKIRIQPYLNIAKREWDGYPSERAGILKGVGIKKRVDTSLKFDDLPPDVQDTLIRFYRKIWGFRYG